jgi:hypothetical protein
MRFYLLPNSLSVRTLLIAGLILSCAAASVVLFDVESSHAGGAANVRGAKAAKTETLNESFHLHLTKVKGDKIEAQGKGTGTITGNVTFNLTLVTASRATAEFGGTNSSGTMSGSGTGNYHVAGAISYFTGNVTSVHGKGRYSGVANLGIKLSGSVNRKTYEMSMTMQGKWHE